MASSSTSGDADVVDQTIRPYVDQLNGFISSYKQYLLRADVIAKYGQSLDSLKTGDTLPRVPSLIDFVNSPAYNEGGNPLTLFPELQSFFMEEFVDVTSFMESSSQPQHTVALIFSTKHLYPSSSIPIIVKHYSKSFSQDFFWPIPKVAFVQTMIKRLKSVDEQQRSISFWKSPDIIQHLDDVFYALVTTRATLVETQKKVITTEIPISFVPVEFSLSLKTMVKESVIDVGNNLKATDLASGRPIVIKSGVDPWSGLILENSVGCYTFDVGIGCFMLELPDDVQFPTGRKNLVERNKVQVNSAENVPITPFARDGITKAYTDPDSGSFPMIYVVHNHFQFARTWVGSLYASSSPATQATREQFQKFREKQVTNYEHPNQTWISIFKSIEGASFHEKLKSWNSSLVTISKKASIPYKVLFQKESINTLLSLIYRFVSTQLSSLVNESIFVYSNTSSPPTTTTASSSASSVRTSPASERSGTLPLSLYAGMERFSIALSLFIQAHVSAEITSATSTTSILTLKSTEELIGRKLQLSLNNMAKDVNGSVYASDGLLAKFALFFSRNLILKTLDTWNVKFFKLYYAENIKHFRPKASSKTEEVLSTEDIAGAVLQPYNLNPISETDDLSPNWPVYILPGTILGRVHGVIKYVENLEQYSKSTQDIIIPLRDYVSPGPPRVNPLEFAYNSAFTSTGNKGPALILNGHHFGNLCNGAAHYTTVRETRKNLTRKIGETYFQNDAIMRDEFYEVFSKNYTRPNATFLPVFHPNHHQHWMVFMIATAPILEMEPVAVDWTLPHLGSGVTQVMHLEAERGNTYARMVKEFTNFHTHLDHTLRPLSEDSANNLVKKLISLRATLGPQTCGELVQLVRTVKGIGDLNEVILESTRETLQTFDVGDNGRPIISEPLFM